MTRPMVFLAPSLTASALCAIFFAMLIGAALDGGSGWGGFGAGGGGTALGLALDEVQQFLTVVVGQAGIWSRLSTLEGGLEVFLVDLRDETRGPGADLSPTQSGPAHRNWPRGRP